MSFDASGAVSYTATGGSADNTNAVANDCPSAAVQTSLSSSWVLTASSTGSATFTAKFRRVANTATFHYNSIIVRVSD